MTGCGTMLSTSDEIGKQRFEFLDVEIQMARREIKDLKTLLIAMNILATPNTLRSGYGIIHQN